MFGQTLVPGWRPYRFHRLLAKKLKDCIYRKVRRLCISVPPQHGKSMLTSVIFPAWAMTLFPSLRIIQASYNRDLSEGFTRDAREIVRSNSYLQLFPRLLDGVDRMGEWETKLGGFYLATSLGGLGTGLPADLIIIDDPFSGAEEAASQKARDDAWRNFTTTLQARLAEDGILIIIQTRWHEDDLIGRVTNNEYKRKLREIGMGQFEFDVINLEAICENPKEDALGRAEGEPLCPEIKSLGFLKYQRATIDSIHWNAMYQGKPRPKGAGLADTKKIVFIERNQVPSELNLMRSWDLSLGDDPESDYSCGAYGAVVTEWVKCEDGVERPVESFYLVHMDRGKAKWMEQKNRIIRCADAEARGGEIGIENVAAWEVARLELETFFQGRTRVTGYRPSKGKAERAVSWLNIMASGRFFVVRGEWNQAFVDELESFPNGIHDDQVDAVSTLYFTYRRGSDLVLA